MQDGTILLAELVLTILVGIILFVALRWTRIRRNQVIITPHLRSWPFYLGVGLGVIILATFVTSFLLDFVLVFAIVSSSVIVFILSSGLWRSIRRRIKGE